MVSFAFHSLFAAPSFSLRFFCHSHWFSLCTDETGSQDLSLSPISPSPAHRRLHLRVPQSPPCIKVELRLAKTLPSTSKMDSTAQQHVDLIKGTLQIELVFFLSCRRNNGGSQILLLNPPQRPPQWVSSTATITHPCIHVDVVFLTFTVCPWTGSDAFPQPSI